MTQILTTACTVNIDGYGRLPITNEATINFGIKKREAVMGFNEVAGFVEKNEDAPSFKVTIVDSGDLDTKFFQDFKGQVSMETNTEQTYILNDAVVTEIGEFNVAEGKMELTFAGMELIIK